MRLLAVLSLVFILLAFSAQSEANDFYQIPLPADAREFARLDNKMPAVLSFSASKLKAHCVTTIFNSLDSQR